MLIIILMEVLKISILVVSKKYIVLLQLLIFAKDIPTCTISENLNEHKEKLDNSFEVN